MLANGRVALNKPVPVTEVKRGSAVLAWVTVALVLYCALLAGSNGLSTPKKFPMFHQV